MSQYDGADRICGYSKPYVMINNDLVSNETSEALEEETLSASNGESLQSKYLRWSIPSLLLAVVSVTLWFQSAFWTEPGIYDKYRRLSKRNLDALKLSEPIYWTIPKFEHSSRRKLTPAEERRLLDETTLALRRLVIRNTRDSWAH